MTVRARYVVAAAIGLCAGHLLPAQEPGRLGLDKPRPAAASPDQQLADSVARQLRESGQLRHYRVDITCRAGLVELSGVVADQGQREEAVRLAQGVQGVERVRDLMTLADGALQQTQAGAPPKTLKDPLAPPPALKDPLAPPPPLKDPLAPPPAANGGVPEPMPLFHAPAPPPFDVNPPRMPPYAWPTYAPYNNFSRVAAPLGYPYNAWPFIGPCYPFPKVPLGWRSVKLSFEDGYWWFSRVATKYDWWRLRYW